MLGVLAEEPRHGFAVARELAADGELGRIWTVRRPLVYRSIEHLLDVGYAEARSTEPGRQGPHRTVVAPTRAGRARLRRWLDEPVEHPRDVRSVLLAKLALRVRAGRELAPVARSQLRSLTPVVTGLERRVDSSTGVERLAVQSRLETARAIRTFLETVVEDDAGRRY